SGRVVITDVKKRAGALNVHFGRVEEGQIAKGDPVRLMVDGARRAAIRANHSATHLMHEALRGTLGDHVAQRGSLVAPDRLRFDFVHQKAMETAELARVEQEVNDHIRQNSDVTTRLMSPEEAQEMGARALFGEKYGDEVRVVTMGARPEGETGPAGRTYSMELCGGTH
ncbi:MAG: alanine--tRNA ligase, partial [Pseudomonadota bacterium]